MVWSRRAALLGATGAVAAIAVAALAMTRESTVTWSRRLSQIGCEAAQPAAECFAWLSVAVGNTGNVDQAAVRVSLPGAQLRWRIDTRSSDIRASLGRRAEPQIARLDTRDAAVYEIRPLPANTVVELVGFCLQCAPEAVRAMDRARIEVQAEARVREGDPRAVTLANALLHFAAGILSWR